MSQRERAAFMGKAGGEPGPVASANDVSHVIAVLSGKGGVGKSSVAALLAVALRRRELRVGVLDADITGPSIPRMFGLHRQPVTSPMGILPVETSTGIKVMSINLLLQSEDQAVIWRGPLIGNMIKQFWTDVAWGLLDYLIVDLPPGTSDASLTVMQSIPLSGVVLVTSPQDLAGMVVRKAAQMAQRLGAPIVGLVENMSYVTCLRCGQEIQVFGPSRAMQTAARLVVPLLGQLPLDAELARRCDEGEIEAYGAKSFDPIVKPLMDRLRAVCPVWEGKRGGDVDAGI
jgi:Mrp family chromosome partitioning ATPase